MQIVLLSLEERIFRTGGTDLWLRNFFESEPRLKGALCRLLSARAMIALISPERAR